jgi:hypothetical protein
LAKQKTYHQHQFLHHHLESLAHLDLQLLEEWLLILPTCPAEPERDQRNLANVFDGEDSAPGGNERLVGAENDGRKY